MTLQEFRSAVQEAVRSGFLARLEDYLARVDAEGTIEDRRKSVELTSKLADAMPEKAEGRGLPVVQIVFGAGGMSASVVQTVESVPQLEQPSDPLQPSQAMRQALGVNLDVEALLIETS